MDMASLQNLMNRHVFAYEGSPLKDVTVEPDGPRLKMKGKLRKGIDIPFSTTASVSTTADGLMRLHVESMKAVGVPTKGLLEFFGLKLDDVWTSRTAAAWRSRTTTSSLPPARSCRRPRS